MAASQPFGFSCKGGLNTNISEIEMLKVPGIATELVNFEVDPDGGYRRVNGYENFRATKPEVGTSAILGLAVYADGIVAAKGTSIYFGSADQDWVKINRTHVHHNGDDYSTFTGRSEAVRTSQGTVASVIYEGADDYGQLIMCDNDNKPFLFKMTGTGAFDTRTFFAEEITVNGSECPTACAVHENHLVVGGTAENPNTLYYSSVNDPSSFTGAGAGAIAVPDRIIGLRSFRNDCIIFCQNSIHKLVNINDTNSIAVVPVTKNVGCLSQFTIQEIGGDLVFLSPDGVRTVAGTARLGDVELSSVSRNIQKIVSDDIVKNVNGYNISSLVLRSKSQYRLFYGSPPLGVAKAKGIIGTFTGQGYEWSETKGIEATATASGFGYDGVEKIVHGDSKGYIYTHDTGNTFSENGSAFNVEAKYQTPYLDFGDMGTRKTLYYVKISATPDKKGTGNSKPKLTTLFDFEDTDVQQPPEENLPEIHAASIFEQAEFNANIFGAADNPLIRIPLQGSCYSAAFRLESRDALTPYTINGIYINYVPTGRR
jgi:hypothetical protein